MTNHFEKNLRLPAVISNQNKFDNLAVNLQWWLFYQRNRAEESRHFVGDYPRWRLSGLGPIEALLKSKVATGTSRLFPQDLDTKLGQARRIADLNLFDFVFVNFEAEQVG